VTLFPAPRAVRSPWRFTVAAACLTAAAAHVPVTEDHLHEAPYIGVLFIVLTAACVLLAATLLVRDAKAVYTAVVVTCAAAVGAYVWSRSVGLPEIHDDVGNWTEPLGLVSVVSETAACLATAAALGWSRVSAWPRQLPVPAGALVLVLGISATATAASSPAQESGMGGMATAGPAHWAAVSGGAFHSDGVTRTYYIGADEVVWNYVPFGFNRITGKPFDEVADTYTKNGPGRIGPKYLKCLYRGYTDATFKHLQQRPASEAYLGLLGPVIRAQVGDTIKVVFRNSCRYPESIHPHGVFYTKSSEGAPYSDGTKGADKADDAVPTGGRHTYVWEVPARAGPGPGDGSSVMWMYHSHTNEVADTYAGLMGPMEITARGMARPDGSPKDVDREVFALFSVMNENESPYLKLNLHRFAKPPFPPLDDEDFQESNLKHSINGYLFGNQPMITMKAGQHVRWYVMSMGTEVDLHTPHWHGNTVTVGGMRADTISLLPATMVVADMVPDDPGIWLFHCHVNDHITAGMLTRYEVTR
jgi:multicopper oxidase